MTLKTVHKIEPGQDPHDVLCTTYQMRNPFRQFYDGVASELDVHCYFQHATAADLCLDGGRVLDICCGRGLLIPFLRYRAKPSLYVGVDIEHANARWVAGADPRREGEHKTDWGFERVFVESNVATMHDPVKAATGGDFNLLVYTSAIEHMQPSAQEASLAEARKLAATGAYLYLTCPVTKPVPGHDGYQTQYAAHVYEPTQIELEKWCRGAGWIFENSVGLCTKASIFKSSLKGVELSWALRLYRTVPRELALPMIATLFPACSTEMAFVYRAK